MRRSRSVVLVVGLLLGLTASLTGSASSLPTSLPASGPNEEVALVEIHLQDRAEIDELLAMGVDLAEYRRDNADGTVTLNAVVTRTERRFLESLGYRFGATIEDESTWEQRRRERDQAIRAERRSHAIAEDGALAEVEGVIPVLVGSAAGAAGPSATSLQATSAQQAAGPGEEAPPGEVTIQRADYFINRYGRFLSVEAKSSQGDATTGPTLSMAWSEDGSTYGTPTTMSKFTDADQYMYHRVLVRIGAAGSTTPVPSTVRVASSTGAFAEDHVRDWPGGQMPPHVDGYQSDFTTHYMDAVEVYDRINDLATEFPNISEVVDLPNATEGYQRKAMGVIGANSPGAAPANPQSAVLLISKAYGHQGGNDVQVDVVFGTPSVSVAGSNITVSIAPGTPAFQVVDAINASAAASSLVTAYPYASAAGNQGLGPVNQQQDVVLDDLLNAPASVPRGRFQPQVLRIGKHRDGSKVGVFLYCQQHAREWATALTCVETAEQLVRNYGIDPVVTELVDNLDIFILPSVNPDGALYSMYDFNMQRRNMTRHCLLTTANGMPASRNAWGVDLNRNNTVGTIFDGYAGASSACNNDTYAGPFEASEPEIQNEHWVVETFDNIKFSNNIHSYGGYFMWAPGAYVQTGRQTLPAPNIGIEGYFFEGAEKILARIEEVRGTVILPQRTGPVADVLYSAAGNSADEQWYRRDIIAYSFETGADLFTSTSTGTSQTPVGFQPNYAAEGKFEGLEFAAGNIGLLEEALAYSRDDDAPVAAMKPNGAISKTPLDATFTFVNEPSVIHYTIDGSTPTQSSPTWEARGPRQPGAWFHFDQTTTVKWIGVDIRGNVSPVNTAKFIVDSVAPTTSVSLTPTPYQGAYVQPSVSLQGTDTGGATVDYTEYRLDGGAWTRFTTAFQVKAAGQHVLEYRSVDKAGNLEETRSLTFDVLACSERGTSGADTLTGTVGDDVICSLGGDDTVNAAGGNDVVVAGPGIDNVSGGDGADGLFGEAGNDTLLGQNGNDTLGGGPGYDTLRGGPGSDGCTVGPDGGKATECE